jgi:hypothetical protein
MNKESLIKSLNGLDYKTLLSVCDLTGIQQLKSVSIKNQDWENAAELRELEKFIATEEYEKLILRKKHEEREKKLLRLKND